MVLTEQSLSSVSACLLRCFHSLSHLSEQEFHIFRDSCSQCLWLSSRDQQFSGQPCVLFCTCPAPPCTEYLWEHHLDFCFPQTLAALNLPGPRYGVSGSLIPQPLSFARLDLQNPCAFPDFNPLCQAGNCLQAEFQGNHGPYLRSFCPLGGSVLLLPAVHHLEIIASHIWSDCLWKKASSS